MIYAHTADLHIDEQKNDSRETLDEQIQRLLWIGEHARKSKAEVMLCAGDIFERTSTPGERNAAVEVFTSWADHMPVVIVYGNHESPEDLDFLAHLKAKHEIFVRSRPDVITLPGGNRISCIPWPRKGWLAGKLKPGQDINQMAIAAMRVLLDGMRANPADAMVGHLEIGTALSDSGQPMVGRADIELSPEDLQGVAKYCALGHIHKPQTFIVPGTTIRFSGSSRQTSFACEPGKGFTLADATENGVEIEHVDAPGRVLRSVELGKGDELSFEFDGDPKGEAIKLKYTVGSEGREQARAEAQELKDKLIAAGAHSVKIDATVTTVQRVRSEAIREASNNAERIDAWWESRGEKPGRAEQIRAKLNELEQEVM